MLFYNKYTGTRMYISKLTVLFIAPYGVRETSIDAAVEVPNEEGGPPIATNIGPNSPIIAMICSCMLYYDTQLLT